MCQISAGIGLLYLNGQYLETLQVRKRRRCTVIHGFTKCWL